MKGTLLGIKYKTLPFSMFEVKMYHISSLQEFTFTDLKPSIHRVNHAGRQPALRDQLG